MSAAAIAGPLVGRLLPVEGWARAVALAGLAVAGSLLLWASAKISVPFWPVPMTLQTGAVALIGVTFGWRLGLATVLLYLAEGAMGFPVFQGTQEKGIGLAYLVGPTGGYLFGMALQVAVTGWLATFTTRAVARALKIPHEHAPRPRRRRPHDLKGDRHMEPCQVAQGF